MIAAMIEHISLPRLYIGLTLLAMALLVGGLLRRLTDAVGRSLAPRAPQWLTILGQGFQVPLIYLARWCLLALALLVLPLPVETSMLLSWLTPASRAVMTVLLCWGLWCSAPLCQLLLQNMGGEQSGSGRTIGRFFENIYKAVVALFAALATLDLLGLPVGSLIAGAGVAGLAVSLAAQSTLSNLIAGVTLVLEQPFSLGDYVTLGEVEGTVEDISFRSTRLRTPDNVLITVENAKVCSEYILNNSNRRSRLWSFDLSVALPENPTRLDHLARAMEQALNGDEQIVPQSAQIIVDRLEADCAVLNVRCYAATAVFAEYRAIKDRLNRVLLDVIAQQGFRLAQPKARIAMEGGVQHDHHAL